VRPIASRTARHADLAKHRPGFNIVAICVALSFSSFNLIEADRSSSIYSGSVRTPEKGLRRYLPVDRFSSPSQDILSGNLRRGAAPS
jgi:hypothetical protein